MRIIPTFWGGVPPHYSTSQAPAPAYSSNMDYAEPANDRLENLWRAKLEEAGVHYSENTCIETKATYLCVIETFADLVLRGEPQERFRWG